jgi:capsular polysaccharide transport system permease protein
LSQTFPDWHDGSTGRLRRRARFFRREFPVAGRLRLGPRWLRIGLRILLVLLPTVAAGAYYGAIATDLYVSEARFIIRTANKPANLVSGLNALLELAGMSHEQDDEYAVRDFLTSRDALTQLESQLNLRAIYADPKADFLTHYPSLIFGKSEEDFYRYFSERLTVVVNNTTGVTTMRVEAFNAHDSYAISGALLDLGESLVNKLNVRMQQDTVRLAEAEVARAEQRRIENQIAITAFRNHELILDPEKSSAMVVELIGRLAGELATVRTQIAETRGNAPNSPQLQSLQQRASAITQQISLERSRVANSSDGLAEKVAEYERLMLQREFAVRTLAQAVAALETARLEARRQQLYLERVVEPGVPDEAIMPRRWRMILTVFGFNVIGVGVLWLIGAGLREHAASAHAAR